MNEASIPWIVLAIVAALGVVFLGLVLLRKRRGEAVATDYRAFFLMGPPLFAAGIAVDNPGIWALGVVYFVLGLSHRDEWAGEEDPAEPGAEAGRRKRAALLLLSGLVTLALLAYGLLR